jgi:hypothetical protein
MEIYQVEVCRSTSFDLVMAGEGTETSAEVFNCVKVDELFGDLFDCI